MSLVFVEGSSNTVSGLCSDRKEGKLHPLPFTSSRDLDCVATGKQILPTFKLEDINDEETFVFKVLTFNSALEEIEFSLSQTIAKILVQCNLVEMKD